MYSYFIRSCISDLTTNQSLVDGVGYNLGENKPSVSQWCDARIEKYIHTFIFPEYFDISWVSTAYIWEEGTLAQKEWLSIGNRASQVALVVRNLPANAGDVRDAGQSLGREDPLEEDMTTHSSVLAWEVPWREEPGRFQLIRSWRAGYKWNDSTQRHNWKFIMEGTKPMFPPSNEKGGWKLLYHTWNTVTILRTHLK